MRHVALRRAPLRFPRALSLIVAAGTSGAITTGATAVRAFCREVSMTAPQNLDASNSGACFPAAGFTGAAPDAGCKFPQPTNGILATYWTNTCVGYSIQKDASVQVALADAMTTADQAFGAWSAATCGDGSPPSLHATQSVPVDCAKVEYNRNGPNQNVIIFHDDVWPYSDPFSTLGLTTVTVDECTGEILDADMEINTTSAFHIVAGADASVPAASGNTYDLRTILSHESGHFLGLAHSADPAAIMFAYYSPGAAGLSPDDVNGICSLYPSGGMRPTSFAPVAAGPCDPTPRHGFSSACGSDGGAMPVDAGFAVPDGGAAGVTPATPPGQAPKTGKGCSAGGGVGRDGLAGNMAVLVAIGGAAMARRRGGSAVLRA